MIKIILIVLLAVVSNSALAGWDEVSGTTELNFYVDSPTIHKIGDQVTMSVLFDYKNPQDAGSGKTMLSSDGKFEYDCTQVKARQINLASYSGHMGSGEVLSKKEKPGNWVQMTPGSINSYLWMVACDVEVTAGAEQVCISSLNAIPISSGSLERFKEWSALGCKADGEQMYLEKLNSLRAFLLEKKGRIQTFDEANLAYQPSYLGGIAKNPLLRPDGKAYGKQYSDNIYVPRLLLDAEEDNNTLRAQLKDPVSDDQVYVYLLIGNNEIMLHSDRLRIGGEISVIGRYVENVKYRTVGGAVKLAPTLEVLFIEAH